jgi:FixJ family two-component response regulator
MSNNNTRPVIFYVDDEPHNLVVFEASCSDDWDVHTYDSPLKALDEIDKKKPWVIVSDQRMPGMTGVQFLEIARKIVPDSIRITVTGYSDEDLVVESVRKAGIFDYIKKPWEADDLLGSIERALNYYRASEEAKRLQDELMRREQELRETNNNLTSALKDLEIARHKEAEMRTELECWVPPFVLWAIREKPLSPEFKTDVVGIAIDIIGSSRLHGVNVNGRSARSQVIQIFSEALLRQGGWRESHSGDSAYGHFGLVDDKYKAAESALNAAREFRVALRSLGVLAGCGIECGIALHIAPECPVQIHTAQLNTPRGPVTQKSFDTSSSDVDLLHRIEKLVHMLPGTNIVMSRAFFNSLKIQIPNIVNVGWHLFAGQTTPVELLIIPSDLAKPEDIERVRAVAVAPPGPIETEPRVA